MSRKNRSRYVDIPANMQVIGGVYANPSLIDNENYSFTLADFTEEFHTILFGSIYNLYKLGAKEITSPMIEKYLSERPEKLAVFKANKGAEYLNSLSETTVLESFPYYYNRMKKFTILRLYDEELSMDMSWLYDKDNIFDKKKKQKQEDWLDNHSMDQLDAQIQSRIEKVRSLTSASTNPFEIIQAGRGGDELLEELQRSPDLGYPLYGDLLNAIFRGARLTKFYITSAPTGVGKSRKIVGDSCNIACDEIYDLEKKQWVPNGTGQPTAYIMTEQTFDEVQTMMWAFLSGVPEHHILENTYEEGELERVKYAQEVLKRSPMYLQEMHDFSLSDIEGSVRYLVKEHGVRYVFLDYLHSSIKILSEVSARSSVKGLREDNVLFMISVKLKDLATEYGVYIQSATQLNADYKNATFFDQNLLRGAKSIADKIDAGSHLLPLNDADNKVMEEVVATHGYEMPNLKLAVYKNRRGKYNNILVWCKADLAICRIEPLFATNYNYELIDIVPLKVNVVPRAEKGAFS